MKVKNGPVTLLAAVQSRDGKLKLLCFGRIASRIRRLGAILGLEAVQFK